ncbi:MAG: hypothetical protein H0T63_05480 [Pyrinomonadaceae bacterium]|nr:hypothetical protein [Pyrinomonadaceae bacterium]
MKQEKYLTVFFDVAEVATRTFEYTMVLLLMAHQVVEQLARCEIKVDNERVKQLAEFLQEKEVTVGSTKSIEGKVSGEAEVGAGLLASILGKLGFGVELGGSFQRSRD